MRHTTLTNGLSVQTYTKAEIAFLRAGKESKKGEDDDMRSHIPGLLADDLLELQHHAAPIVSRPQVLWYAHKPSRSQ